MDRVVGHKVVKPNSASNLSASSFGVSNAQDTNINAEGRFCYNEELGIKPWSVTPQTTLRELLSILGIKPEMKRQIGNFGSASNIYSTNNTVGMSSVGTTDEADETERNESCKENRSCKEACEKSRKESRKIRGVNKLRQSANCLLTIQLEEDGKPNGSIELFDSGHCIYDNGYSRTTIVDIANCTDFTYYFSVRETEKKHLNERSEVDGELIDSAWPIAIVVVGEEQIKSNMKFPRSSSEVASDPNLNGLNGFHDLHHEPHYESNENNEKDENKTVPTWSTVSHIAEPEKKYMRNEIITQIRYILEGILDSEQLELLQMRYVDGLSPEKIARDLGCSRYSLYDRFFYIEKKVKSMRKQLMELLEDLS